MFNKIRFKIKEFIDKIRGNKTFTIRSPYHMEYITPWYDSVVIRLDEAMLYDDVDPNETFTRVALNLDDRSLEIYNLYVTSLYINGATNIILEHCFISDLFIDFSKPVENLIIDHGRFNNCHDLYNKNLNNLIVDSVNIDLERLKILRRVRTDYDKCHSTIIKFLAIDLKCTK
jgi:hypothetical protein